MLLLFSGQPLIAEDFKTLTAEDVLTTVHTENLTPCASERFARALDEHRNEVSEDMLESEVRAWAQTVMFDAEVLLDIMECDEIKNADEGKPIVFTPIIFKFNGNQRSITINYSAEPKVLRQRLTLATKPSLPSNGNPNPELMSETDPAIYINTDPAWYAIMVVQHDSLSNFVGKDKNNTLSIKWIDDNIDSIYPQGAFCTSKSALANDHFTINEVVRKVVSLEKDSNDYYVAGDVNLEWVMYAEILLDVVITVVTLGSGEVALVSAKLARATKAAKNLSKSIKALTKLEDVKAYITVVRQITTHTDDLAKLGKYEKNLKTLEKARKAGQDVTKYEKELESTLKAAKKIDPSVTAEALKNPEKIKDLEKILNDEVKSLEQTAKQMEKESKNVKKYKESSEIFSDVMKYRRNLRAFRRNTGNIATKSLKGIKAGSKTLKAAESGEKVLSKAGRIGRKGMSSFSSKAKNWLYDSTLKYGGRIAKFERNIGGIYGVISFLGDMYDKTSSTSSEYSNGIEFKPLVLLFADDIEGQENEVNYGTWLRWIGDSEFPEDDNAAYLQATDFATKFHHKLVEYQEENGANCNVDIYVVHPIIRLDETDPDNTTGELFYLFMNDEPWTTAGQF